MYLAFSFCRNRLAIQQGSRALPYYSLLAQLVIVRPRSNYNLQKSLSHPSHPVRISKIHVKPNHDLNLYSITKLRTVFSFQITLFLPEIITSLVLGLLLGMRQLSSSRSTLTGSNSTFSKLPITLMVIWDLLALSIRHESLLGLSSALSDTSALYFLPAISNSTENPLSSPTTGLLFVLKHNPLIVSTPIFSLSMVTCALSMPRTFNYLFLSFIASTTSTSSRCSILGILNIYLMGTVHWPLVSGGDSSPAMSYISNSVDSQAQNRTSWPKRRMGGYSLLL